MNNKDDIDPEFEDRARGCILGAFCGDAIGAFLEFEKVITNDKVDEAMKLNGGGYFKIGPGQVTDDGELSLCLGQGLIAGEGVLDLNQIATYYKMWIESGPFDKGITIHNALSKARGETCHLARKLRSGAKSSSRSQSNGGLMRISPLCVWASKLNDDEIMLAVREETKLTHSNVTAINTK